MSYSAPCKDCPNRTPGCHGTCAPYKTWAREQYETKTKIAEAFSARQYIPESLKKLSYEQWKDKAKRGRGKIT